MYTGRHLWARIGTEYSARYSTNSIHETRSLKQEPGQGELRGVPIVLGIGRGPQHSGLDGYVYTGPGNQLSTEFGEWV
jgi:hypothetical protein